MRISHFSVHHPVLTSMVTLIVLLLGGIALVRLPVDLMPDITYPTLSVSTTYENAGPEEMEELITRPVEQALSAVPGVTDVTSTSAEGNSNVRVTFAWGTNLEAAAGDVRDRLDRVIPRLPDDAARPVLRKFDLAAFPILIMGAASDLDPIQARRIIDDQVKYRIERVPGVAALEIIGGLQREIRVGLDRERIKALGLSLDQILTRIKASNVNVPAGSVNRGNYEVTLRTPGEFNDVDELRHTVIALREGVPVELQQVATIEDTMQRVREIVRVNGKSGIRLAVTKQSGMNTVEVARNVQEELKRLAEDIPQVRLVPIIDTSDYVRRSITNVGDSALYGGILTILVLYVFLRNVRSTLIIMTAIPTACVATFALMYFCGFTLNLMTMGGLALGIGMLVDDAIVVLENIFRLREGGMPGEDAAVEGSEEVMAAVVASTLTTVAVFLPVIFVRGMTGVMFKQLSTVVSFALLCSLVSAVALVPMLAAKLFRDRGKNGARNGAANGAPSARKAGGVRWIEDDYKAILHWALTHRLVVVVGVLIVLGSSLALVPLIGVELMPATDEGEVRINVEMEVGTRLGITDQVFRKIETIVTEKVPELYRSVASIGSSGWRGGGASRGDMRISLVPQAQRQRSSQQVADALRPLFSQLPGTTIRVNPASGMFMMRMGSGGGDRLEIEVRGHDLETADRVAAQVRQVVAKVAGVTDVRLSRESGAPEQMMLVDRAKAAALKLTVDDVAKALQTAVGGSSAGNYREAGKEHRILVQLRNVEQTAVRDILDLTVTNADGQAVVLRNVISVVPRRGPVLIERTNQERVITVSANYTQRDMGAIVRDVRVGLQDVPLPRDFTIDFGGDYEEQQKSFHELLISFVLALVLVYMVMACVFESLRDPFIVMFSVPLAAIGVILTLFLTNTTLNIQSYIGCIMLAGIVVKNAILLVDHTNLLRQRDGYGVKAALEEAGRRRLRPILMTTMTTILALLPLALGMGEGAEAQAPLARAVIGGLVSSTLITLIFVPVVYSLFEREPPPAPATTPAPTTP